ncbi:MAG: alpha-L-rhamnosidase N-terminal domain-containing protein, partial [Planctomycetota bacterium]|nr:alpha-L-rhamnosidase N-terminal domain-containing protein [Planctomycetota bacterium]
MSARQEQAARSPSPARWIWTPRREYVNQHVYLRKRIELPAAPAQARIRVTADTRYRLFVNGAAILRGPARGFPQMLPFDELDIAPFLVAGPNVLAAHVLSFGVSTAQNVFRDRAGFYLEGVVTCANGAAVALDTDATWRVHEAAGFRKHVSRSAPQLGYQEHYDAARDTAAAPPGVPEWTCAAYDDAAWQEPHVLGAAGVLPWRAMEERGIPLLETSAQLPRRIVGQWDAQDRLCSAPPDESTCNVASAAAAETRRPAATVWFQRAEALLSGGGARLVPVRPGACAALVVDFGETRFGHPVLRLSEAAGGEVFDLLYGEQTAEGGIAVLPRTDASPGDRLICRAGANRFETLQARGFRYLMLIARNIRQPLTVEQLA